MSNNRSPEINLLANLVGLSSLLLSFFKTEMVLLLYIFSCYDRMDLNASFSSVCYLQASNIYGTIYITVSNLELHIAVSHAQLYTNCMH